MERVSVQGVPGSGKSTVSRTIALRLGLPYIELDALHHGPAVGRSATAGEARAAAQRA